MISPDAVAAASILLLVSFLPPALLAVRLRRLDARRPEPSSAVARAFLWGAIGAAALAILAQRLLAPTLSNTAASLGLATAGPLIALLILAPLTEETAKALGLARLRDDDPEPEDGLVYGGAAGLGFAATENLLYVLSALLLGGLAGGITTAIYRSVATVALHAATGALVGLGLWRARITNRRLAWIPLIAMAVTLHAAYNALATVQLALAAILAVALALFAYVRVERHLRMLDAA